MPDPSQEPDQIAFSWSRSWRRWFPLFTIPALTWPHPIKPGCTWPPLGGLREVPATPNFKTNTFLVLCFLFLFVLNVPSNSLLTSKIFFFWFGLRQIYAAQAGLEAASLLSQPSKCWANQLCKDSCSHPVKSPFLSRGFLTVSSSVVKDTDCHGC